MRKILLMLLVLSMVTLGSCVETGLKGNFGDEDGSASSLNSTDTGTIVSGAYASNADGYSMNHSIDPLVNSLLTTQNGLYEMR